MAVLTRDFASERGGELALADDNGELTWNEFDLRVNRVVHAFRAAGLQPGDTICVVLGNYNEWFEIAMGCANSGVIFVPVNWHLVAPEMAYIFNDSGSRAVIAGHQYTEMAAKALADNQCPDVELSLAVGAPDDSRFVQYEEFLAAASADEPDNQVFGGPMFYTSGTTGSPKGVKGALSGLGPDAAPDIWQLIGAGFAAMVPDSRVTVLCGPFYHSAQWAFSFFPLIAGSAVVMQHKYDSAGVLNLIDRHSATNIHLVPTQMKRLVDLPDDVKANFDGSSLTTVLHGAAPCPPVVKQSMIDWWGPKITEYYGSTEGSIITMCSSEEWIQQGGSVGTAMPNVEIMVIGENGERLGVGEQGTLYFRNGTGADFEYHNAPEKTAEAHLEPGVFTTGDVGMVDENGYVWLGDRKIDMIISGGVNIYPAEIEGALGGHPDVADVAVIGAPNNEFGEEVKAVIVLGAAAAAQDADAIRTKLNAFCRENLAGYKVPRSFDFVDALPRTGTGKVKKRELRDPLWEGRQRS